MDDSYSEDHIISFLNQVSYLENTNTNTKTNNLAQVSTGEKFLLKKSSCIYSRKLFLLLDRLLPEGQKKFLESHRLKCKVCRDHYRQFKALYHMISNHIPDVLVNDERVDDLRGEVRDLLSSLKFRKKHCFRNDGWPSLVKTFFSFLRFS